MTLIRPNLATYETIPNTSTYRVAFDDASGWYVVWQTGEDGKVFEFSIDVARFRSEPDAHQYVTDHERRGY